MLCVVFFLYLVQSGGQLVPNCGCELFKSRVSCFSVDHLAGSSPASHGSPIEVQVPPRKTTQRARISGLVFDDVPACLEKNRLPAPITRCTDRNASINYRVGDKPVINRLVTRNNMHLKIENKIYFLILKADSDYFYHFATYFLLFK